MVAVDAFVHVVPVVPVEPMVLVVPAVSMETGKAMEPEGMAFFLKFFCLTDKRLWTRAHIFIMLFIYEDISQRKARDRPHW